MAIIKESFRLSATTADVLAAPSRLAAIPKNGILTIEASASVSNGTNRGQMTLQLPNGDVPFEDLLIPANGFSTEDIMHSDTELLIVLAVAQGGHVGLLYTEIGALSVLMYVSLTF